MITILWALIQSNSLTLTHRPPCPGYLFAGRFEFGWGLRTTSHTGFRHRVKTSRDCRLPPFPAKSAERQSSVPETSSAVRARDVGIGLSGLSVLTAKQSTTTTTTRIKPGRQALPCPALRRSSSSGLSYLSFFSILVLTTILQPRNQGRKIRRSV